MTITLYFVQGISMSDTPLFSTKAKQDEYFEKHIVKTVETAYYPPYYFNTIKLETEDCDLTTNANYLSIDTGTRRYYYFIGSITYLNEDVYEIGIEMDVIQTYLFDIRINSCQIDRKFIDRYDSNGLINRDYIRENVSNGVMTPYAQHSFDPKDGLTWFVIRTTDNKGNLTIGYPSPLEDVRDNIDSQYCYYFVPYYRGIRNFTLYKGDDTLTGEAVTFSNLARTLATLARQTAVVDINYIPYNIFPDTVLQSYSVSSDGESLSVHFTTTCNVKPQMYRDEVTDVNVYCCYFDNTGDSAPVYMASNHIVDVNQHDYFHFVKTTEKEQTFSYYRVPALLDNNYFELGYGVVGNYASIDLFLLQSGVLTFSYDTSPLMITRFDIYPHEDMIGKKNMFFAQSFMTVSNTLICDVINDTWLTWKSQNTFTAVSAGIKDIARLGMNLAGAHNANAFATKSALLQTSINNVQTRRAYYGMKGMKGIVTSSTPWATLAQGNYDRQSTNQLRTLENRLTNADRDNTIRSNNLSVADFPNSLMGVATDALNAKFAPDTAKELGTYGNDIISGKSIPNLIISRVDDIDECSWYFHKNGYLVDENYNYLSDSTATYAYDYLFNYVNTRYYFNVLKCSGVNVSLNNVINDSGTLAEISARLTEGIRLWNVDNVTTYIGDFRFDNVEKSFLEE